MSHPRTVAFTVIASMSLQGLRKVRLELGESVLSWARVCSVSLPPSWPVWTAACRSWRWTFPLSGANWRCGLVRDAVFSPDDPDLKTALHDLTRGRA
jgi:hypothetical protein